MPTEEIAFLKNRRGGFKGRITGVQNELNSGNEISLARAQSMLDTIQKAYDKFDEIQAQLERADEAELGSIYRTEVDALFDNVRYTLVDLIDQKKAHVFTGPSTSNRPKLPDLTVPKFNGEMLNWLNFKSVFEEIVVKQTSLDNVSKYQYLETSLSGGSAYELIKSVTGSDFVTAWSKLEVEYNHMGLIREKHCKDLYDVEPTNGKSNDLQRFLDKIESNMHSLRALEVNVEHWDLLLIHHLSSKFDVKTRKEFESMKKPDSNVSYEQFKSFIKNRIRVMSAMESVVSFEPSVTSTPNNKIQKSEVPRNNNKHKVLVAREAQSCPSCNESHSLFHCKSFMSMDVQSRQTFVRSKKLCFNCLSSGHWSNACTSSGKCKKCSKLHHTLLCVQNDVPQTTPQTAASALVNTVLSKRIILATATVSLENPVTGQSVICRAFLDGGATTHFVTEHIVQLLSLPKLPSFTEIGGINDTITMNKHKVIATVKSRTSNFSEEVELLVSRRIVGDLPTEPIDISQLDIQSFGELADPNFNDPTRIDLLLGASIFFKIISGSKKEISPGLYLLPSQFGNILVGQQESTQKATVLCSIQRLQEQIQKFWEIEQTVFSNNHTLEEKLAERHYAATFNRCLEGKYVVGLPFNDKVNELGDSRDKTKMIFLRQEANLVKNPAKYEHYKEFVDEMIRMEHLEETNSVGPTIQKPIFSHLIQWREHAIGLIGDIAKMYRQIWHHPDDRDFLKIWWRFTPHDDLKSYRIKVVTYGTASAPFLAIRTLFQLATDEEENYPEAAKLLRENFYVDDFSCSFRDVHHATQMKHKVTELLQKGGFELRKFSSNSSELVPDPTEGNVVKTLGVTWNTSQDQIVLEFNDIYFHVSFTKSSILSEIAQIFDPLGLCAPIVLRAKFIMQKIWQQHDIKWDDTVPKEIQEEWSDFRQQIRNVNAIVVPRALIRTGDKRIEIHGFADASERGYGAAIYLRSESGCHLVCSKSRVAPLKKMTIPRLELQAALLLARLVKITKGNFSENYPTYFWSDSEITLYRIKSSPNRYCTFVGTRLSEIQELTCPTQWCYIPTKINPADICSRGLMPSELIESNLWWHGPSFLTNDSEQWPSQSKFEVNETQLELKENAAPAVPKMDDTFIVRFSNYQKLLRVTSYIMRFYNIVSKKTTIKQSITTSEIHDSLIRLVRYSQHLTFKDDLKELQRQKSVTKQSRLKYLNPFIDNEGVLRVGGRLNNAKLSYDNQHQMILSNENHFSRLILKHIHRENLHCGPLTLLNTSRQRFWIMNGRNLAKKVVRLCVTCFKNKPILINQIMGQLPENRLSCIRPFHTVGIDYCGYFLIKHLPRSKVTITAYICLLTCFVTRATHLEIVYDLTTEAFLAALRRFVSRRGLPAHIHSDNATNFVGASRQLLELKELQMSQLHQLKVEQFCCDNSIQWHFIPPKSPHFGALWESSVKQAKYHLKRSVHELIFTIEQLSTIVCQIEAILNSRPLTPLSDDPEDFKALTPGHFLIGQELNAIPEPSMLELNVNRLSIWQKIQYVTQEFWKKWQLDYINSLQSRQKWTETQPNIQVGRLVLLAEDNIPVSQWLLGRIIEIHPGKDGIVRVVTVKTANNTFKRSIVKIAPLPIE